MNKFFIFFLMMVLLFPIVKAVPEIPHQFYGNVIYLDDPIPNGHTLTAKIGKEEFTVDIIDGQYGIEAPLLISKDSSDNANEIDFYVDNKKIYSQNYYPGELTELDLEVPSNIILIKETTIDDLSLEIGGSDDLLEEFTGIQEVVFKENNQILVKFGYDFDSFNVVDLLKDMIIKTQEGTAEKGWMIIKGVDLPYGGTKTVYIKDISGTTNEICIKDAEISSISEISGQCNAADETLLTCSSASSTKNGYTCTDLGYYYKVEGLKHSGVIEMGSFCGDGTCNGGESCSSCSTDCGACDNNDDDNGGSGSSSGTISSIEDETSSETCEPDWECYPWLACVNGIQTRICYDANKCGTNYGKPAEGRECAGTEENSEEIQTTASAENKEKNSGINSITGAAFALGGGNIKGFAITTVILVLFTIGLMVAYFIKKNRKKGFQSSQFENEEAPNPDYYQF